MKLKLVLPLMGVALLLAACGPSGPSTEMRIRQAVAGTLSAIPTPTRGAMPTPFATPTTFSLVGLFCEYQFCIGHPQDMAFFDVSAQRNPGAPSTYAQGIMAAYNANLFIQLLWQTAPGATDAQFLLDLIIDKDLDATSGQASPRKVKDMNTVFVPITTKATAVLPYGGAGAWTCGDRAFAWKAYTPDNATAESLFNDALNRFNCRK